MGLGSDSPKIKSWILLTPGHSSGLVKGQWYIEIPLACVLGIFKLGSSTNSSSGPVGAGAVYSVIALTHEYGNHKIYESGPKLIW